MPRVLLFSILQSQFIEKGFKKNENFEHDAVLLLFLFTLGSVIFKEVSQKLVQRNGNVPPELFHPHEKAHKV